MTKLWNEDVPARPQFLRAREKNNSARVQFRVNRMLQSPGQIADESQEVENFNCVQNLSERREGETPLNKAGECSLASS